MQVQPRVFSIVLMGLAVLGGCSDDGSQASQSESEPAGWGREEQPAENEVAEGKRIAERECASCHAIDRTSRSPNTAAPPLREVLAANDPENIAYRFIEAMRVGHDAMPLFDFDVKTADALIAYIKSISG